MTVLTHPQLAQSLQLARLRQVLNWIGLAVVVVGMLEVAAAIFLSFHVIAIHAAGMFSFGIVLWLARSQALRGELRAAVLLTCGGIYLLGILTAFVLPMLLPILVLYPIIVVAIAFLYIGGRALYSLSVAAVLILLIITVVSQSVTVFDAPPPLLVSLLLICTIPIGTGLTLLLLRQFRHRLTETLAQTQAANNALRDAHENLEVQVAERTLALKAALEQVQAQADDQARLLEENERQRSTIYELSVPVLPISAGTLVMPLVGALDSARLLQVRERALQVIQRSSARQLLLDITGVPIVDSQVAQELLSTVQAARLLGAEVWLVGIRPEVAQAIVELGLDLRDLRTSTDLQMALGTVAVR